jgi:ABC-type transporter Mla subunit MlaD
VTQLRAAGITGIVFIELDRRNLDDPVLLPSRGVASPYPVIPSQTSQTRQILSSMDRIMERLEQVDLSGISEQAKHAARAVEGFFTAGRLPQIMANIERVTAGLDDSLKRIDRLLAGEAVGALIDETRQGIGEARQGVAETRQGIAEARRLVAQLGKEIESLSAGEVTQKAAAAIEGIDRRTHRLGRDLGLTTEEFRQMVEALRQLIEELRANPSELLFSRPRTDDQQREER